MSLKSIIGGFVQVPKAGLSAEQVQALIDAAPKAMGAVHTDDAFAHGALGGVVTSAARNDVGSYSIALTGVADTNYAIVPEFGNFAVAVISSKSGSGFDLTTNDITGNPVEVNVMTISIVKTPPMVAP